MVLIHTHRKTWAPFGNWMSIFNIQQSLRHLSINYISPIYLSGCLTPHPCFQGVFIICWLPFFLTHVLKAHCQSCCISPSLYSAVTWLGYLNSAVNPVIYTTFNIEFRKAFIKILHCWEPRRAELSRSYDWLEFRGERRVRKELNDTS